MISVILDFYSHTFAEYLFNATSKKIQQNVAPKQRQNSPPKK